MDPKLITPLLICAAIVGLLYRRIRRNFGRQPISAPRLYFRAGLLGVVGAVLLAGVVHETTLVAWLLGGIAGGALLGLISLRHTRFELDQGTRFYRPHAYIGVLIVALFVGRVIFRFATVYTHAATASADHPLSAYEQSPVTLGIVGLLVGYYLLYNLGVLNKARRLDAHQDLMT